MAAAVLQVCELAAGVGGWASVIGGLSIAYATIPMNKRTGITIGGTTYSMTDGRVVGTSQTPLFGHPLIKQLVNRTPPITSVVQIRLLALRAIQCFQPSRKDPIRPPFRGATGSFCAGCGIVSSGCASLARALASSTGLVSTI